MLSLTVRFFVLVDLFWRCLYVIQSKLVVLRSLAVFLQQALFVAGDEPSNRSPSWYMSSAFTSARARKSFDVLFDPSLASGTSKVIWKPEAAPSDEQFVGAFPLVDAGVDDEFSLQELSDFHSAVTAQSGSSTTRLKCISVRFLSCSFPRLYLSVHSVWHIRCIPSSSLPS